MAAIGEVDEANAAIGVAIAALHERRVARPAAAHPERPVRPRRRCRDARRGRGRAAHRRRPGRAARARDRRDERDARAVDQLHPSRRLAGVAALHLARAVVRRAERAAVALNEAEPLNPQLSPTSTACPINCSSPRALSLRARAATCCGSPARPGPRLKPVRATAQSGDETVEPFTLHVKEEPRAAQGHRHQLHAEAQRRRAIVDRQDDRLIAASFASMVSNSAKRSGIADHDIKPGVTSDEGEGDAWPDIRRRISPPTF